MRSASLRIGFAVVALMASLASVHADEKTPAKEGTAYNNPELKFSLTIPRQWTRRENPPTGSMIFTGPASEKFRPTMSILVQNRPGATAKLDEYADALFQISKQKMPDASDPEKTEMKLGNAAAIKLVYTATLSGHPMKFMKVAAFSGDKAYVITYTHVAAGYAAQLPDAQAMLDSFEFKK